MTRHPSAVHLLYGYRPGQLTARVRNRVRRRLPVPLARDAAAPSLRMGTLFASTAHATRRFAGTTQAARMRNGRVELLSVERSLSDRLWLDSTAHPNHLWAFTLHYHEYLVPLLSGDRAERDRAMEVVSSWLRSCPAQPAALALAWHPYVCSTRIMPWLAILAGEPAPEVGQVIARSLWRQVRVIARNIEWDVGGNHAIRNAKALAVGAGVFHGTHARRLRRRGQALLLQLLQDQTRSDGAHVEQSPTYHALVLEDALDTIAAAQPDDDVGEIRDIAGLMLAWLLRISPPSLPRPHLNDSADGHADTTAGLMGRATDLDVSVRSPGIPRRFPRYVVMGDQRTRLLLDAGPPARRDLPYHAHADSLSIVVQVDGVPIIVDRGVGTYEAGPEREWWRSTAAHSTVEVGGLNSSEVVGAFRAGRLAQTHLEMDEPSAIIAAHDGAGRRMLAHVRECRQIGARRWELVDRTPYAADFVARLHFAPGTTLSLSHGQITACVGQTGLLIEFPVEAAPMIETTPHAAKLGQSTPAPTLVLRSPTREMRLLVSAP